LRTKTLSFLSVYLDELIDAISKNLSELRYEKAARDPMAGSQGYPKMED